MPLKIVGAGFGRTGTLSTALALRELGFPCYHMTEILDNPENTGHLDFWCRVADSPPGTPHDWERVFARYAACVDNPASCVWHELLAAYPEAKVLLTVHPEGAEAWYESTLGTIYFTESMWQFRVLRFLTPFGCKFGRMCQRLIWKRAHRGTMDDREAALARYRQHIDEVKAAVPPERLLVFSVDQGWEPLCAFLGVPVPATPFPRVNDRVAFRKRIVRIARAGYAVLALALLALLAAVGAIAYGIAVLGSRG